MDKELGFRTAICSEYERLLEACQRSLVTWRERSEEITRFGLEGNRIGDEMRKLQADYAKAYNRLSVHAKRCDICCFTAGLAKAGAPKQMFIFPRREMSA
jgi:hypothetical protein